MDSLTTYVRSQLQRAATEKFDIHDIDCEIQIPYLFLTPKELEIDLRLFSRSIMRKALPILLNILERERRGWFLHFRERLISELRDKKMTDTEIEEEVNAAVMQEYLQRVYSSVLKHPELAELGDKISNCLVQQAQSVVIMQKAYERVERDIRFSIIEQKNHLVNEYPVLSRVKPWLKMKLKAAELHKLSKCKWSVHEEALNISQKHNLQQTAYFISRDLTFMREREPVFVEELRKIKTPTRCFCWPCRIWSPKNWIVRRNFQGFSEVIPNVICQQATSIVTPRSDPSQPIFLVEKEVIRKNSTRWPFWRLLNLLQRIWCYVWNAMYLLGFVVPYESPVSIRALLKVKPIISNTFII
ncbi:uncharacterized protein LOC116336853 [Contarinia nasturtii]|uniref:uncharacterized protein LOC116336853 n=1 Tax=Contarinia nasturtii TaxID=265458 RepID=UPI0012D3737E|nr:uncharacterized protein LOC116336853 [Contarinia nasturtii]